MFSLVMTRATRVAGRLGRLSVAGVELETAGFSRRAADEASDDRRLGAFCSRSSLRRGGRSTVLGSMGEREYSLTCKDVDKAGARRQDAERFSPNRGDSTHHNLRER
jgi:hypothetical protein